MQRFFLLLFLLIAASLQAQSPWARAKAGMYVQAGYQFIPTYGALFHKGGDITLDHLVSERQLQLYGEYGIGEKTTLVASIPYVFNERGADNPDSNLNFAQENTGKIAGVGNVQLAIRHQFHAGKWAMAGALRFGLPAPTTYQPLTDLRTGYAALTIQPMLSAGIGRGSIYGYAYAGYGYRSNHYSDFANGGIEAGIKWWKLWLSGFSDIVIPVENGSRRLAGIDALTGLYANDQGWVSLGGKMALEWNRFFGINAYYAGAASGKNVPKSPAVGFGVFVKWD